MNSLAEKNPSVVEYQIALAEIDLNFAKAEDRQKDRAKAAANFQDAVTLLAPLMNEFLGDVRYRYNLIVALDQVTQTHPDRSRREAAVALLRELQARLRQGLPEFADPATAKDHLRLIEATLAKIPAESAQSTKR
jgi:hypothetical protein